MKKHTRCVHSGTGTDPAKMGAAEHAELGITDRLIRLSVGIENSGVITEDLSQAL